MGQTQAQNGGIKSAFNTFLVTLVVLGLMGLVSYLLSDINHRRFRLVSRGHALTVEQGLYLPFGFGAYHAELPPNSPVAAMRWANDMGADALALHDVYAPIPLPLDIDTVRTPAFEDRAELDKGLFDLLSGWAKPRLASTEAATVAEGVYYVRRLEVLPGLSEDQRLQLRQLRAHVAFVNGGRILQQMGPMLRRAQADYRMAVELGSPHAAEAQRMIVAIDQRLSLLETGLEAPPKAPAAEKGEKNP